MLSIVVTDALIGIDVMKKYPVFYSRMLVDEELQTAFLDILELLEQSRAGELPKYLGPDTTNLDFLQQVSSNPIIRKTCEGRLEFIWQRTATQLQKMFSIAALQRDEGYRPADLFLDERNLNLLHGHVEIGKPALSIRLDIMPAVADPISLNLILFILAPEGMVHQFEATIVWGDYRHTVEVNKFGLVRFPPLKTTQLFAPAGELSHDLELRLEQAD